MGVICACIALLLDRLLGEPRRWHPLVGFGRLAMWLEHRCNQPGGWRRGRGLLCAALLVLCPALLGVLIQHGLNVLHSWLGVAFAILVLYGCIGWRSLEEHAAAVVQPLSRHYPSRHLSQHLSQQQLSQRHPAEGNIARETRPQEDLAQGNLDGARLAVSRLVSRDTASLDAEGVARATVESVLENSSDALFASLFWFAIAGVPGVLLHRAANTLDAMWGYRNARFNEFGWAAARLDDVLNILPARLTALAFVVVGRLQGDGGRSWRCWREQAPGWDSPNAGPVMAAGAGALGVSLGGPTCYEGIMKQRPILGQGGAADATAIERAMQLVWRSLFLSIMVWGAVELVFAARG